MSMSFFFIILFHGQTIISSLVFANNKYSIHLFLFISQNVIFSPSIYLSVYHPCICTYNAYHYQQHRLFITRIANRNMITFLTNCVYKRQAKEEEKKTRKERD